MSQFKIGGAATDVIGYYGATPIVQPVGAAQATVTDNSGGAAAPTTGVVANAYKQTVVLPVQLLDLAAGTFAIALPFAFTVTAALFRTAKPASTGGKAAALTVVINGSAATGGVMSLTTANQNTIGGTVAASAISGATTGTAGQTIGVTASSVTTFSEGDGWVEFTVTNNDLKNAAATIIALENALQAALVSLGHIKGSA